MVLYSNAMLIMRMPLDPTVFGKGRHRPTSGSQEYVLGGTNKLLTLTPLGAQPPQKKRRHLRSLGRRRAYSTFSSASPMPVGVSSSPNPRSMGRTRFDTRNSRLST